MNIKVLLPSAVFALAQDVRRIVVETTAGSLGLLPQRLDCVAALLPGILSYELATGSTEYIAVDEGVLIKAGADVLISVRRAIRGGDLARLRDEIKRHFVVLDSQERDTRAAMLRMESGLTRRFAGLERA